MRPTHNTLSISIREKVVALLQEHLANCVDLHSQVKQAEWNVKGPHFLALQGYFHKLAEVAAEHCDSIARRISALGGRADGTVRIAAIQSTVTEFPFEAEEGLVHAAAIAERMAPFGVAIRATAARVAKCKDMVTAELLINIDAAIDESLWVLDAHLQSER